MSADRAHLLSLVAPLKIPPTSQQADFMLQSGTNEFEFHKMDLNTTIEFCLFLKDKNGGTVLRKISMRQPSPVCLPCAIPPSKTI